MYAHGNKNWTENRVRRTCVEGEDDDKADKPGGEKVCGTVLVDNACHALSGLPLRHRRPPCLNNPDYSRQQALALNAREIDTQTHTDRQTNKQTDTEIEIEREELMSTGDRDTFP
jgi:hypothetical protein